MPSYNIHKIKSRRSYNLSEIASLFGIDRKTCSRWIKNEGLEVIEKNVNPLLVMGENLISFIKEKRKKKKMPLKENEIYCFKCHKAVIPKKGSIRVIKTGKKIGLENREQYKKIGICEVCGTGLNKFLGVCQKD